MSPTSSRAAEETAIMRALEALSAQGGAPAHPSVRRSALDEVAEVACDLLVALLGSHAAVYLTGQTGQARLLAASEPGSFPVRIGPRPGALVGGCLVRAEIVSSRIAPLEPELAATGHPFLFAVASPSTGERRSILVLAGSAQAAVSVAVSSLPARIVEVLDEMLSCAE